jgi:glycosyltransferase involved in cell wall biosynthesis
VKKRKLVKIAIDISPTQNENAQRGVGFYTSRLVKALREELKTNPDYRNWTIDLVTSSSTQKYDLFHYPYFDPFFTTLPKREDTPIVVTVHDLIPIRYPKQYPAGLRGGLAWQIQKRNLKRADLLITDSHFSKYEIYDLAGYPVDQIYVTPLASDPIFLPTPGVRKTHPKLRGLPAGDPSGLIVNKYSLPNKFVLYVGDINWNKNIPALVTACQDLKYPLVIVGSAATRENVPDHPWNQDLLWLQKKAKNSKLIHLTGFVSDQDLAKIYNLATLYCQPSIAEGFGLPLLEAMSSGCPTVYAHASSLIELSNYSGQYFHPDQKGSLKKALKKVWTSPSLQKELVKKGLDQAAQFDWQLTALQTLAVYKLLL